MAIRVANLGEGHALDGGIRLPGTASSVGLHTLHAGDCRTVIDELSAQSIDVVVTSPPYNLNLAYGAYRDTKEEADYLDWLTAIAESLVRVLKPEGSFFLNISGSNSQPWLPFELIIRLRKYFSLQNHITWIKSIGIGADSSGHFKPIPGKRFMHHNHEHIFHLTLSNAVDLDRLSIGIPFQDKSNIARRGHERDLRCRGNTWFLPYSTVRSKTQKFNHPGTFPVELPLWCIYLHGQSNATVLDPFLGTGTTLVAAQLAGVRGIGIDIDPEYINTARGRLEDVTDGAVTINLSRGQMSALLKQEPVTRADGGFQSLMILLQNRLNKSTGHITLTRSELERIERYASNYKSGGWQARLCDIFSDLISQRDRDNQLRLTV